MDSLYILESGSYIRKDGDCLKIMRDRTVLETIPASGLQQLTLAGRTSLSGAVLDFLIKNKIDTVFLDIPYKPQKNATPSVQRLSGYTRCLPDRSLG